MDGQHGVVVHLSEGSESMIVKKLMRELGGGLEVPTQEHDDSEALMQELGSSLEVPMRELEHKLQTVTR